MKKFAFTAVLVAAAALSVFAQKEQTILGSSGLRFSGAWGTSTTNLTFYGDESSVTTGGYGGLEFGKTLLVGWGGFSNSSDFKIVESATENIRLNYNGLVLGYAPKVHVAIHPQFMLMTGGGNVRVAGEGSDGVFVVQPSAGVELNVLRWFRIGIDGGYRFVSGSDFSGFKDSDLSAPFGQLTFKFGYSWGSGRNKKNDDLDD